MTFANTLRVVLTSLEAAGIPHMIAGSVASTHHGEPRATQDVDVVIDPDDIEALDRFVSRLDRDHFYVGDQAAAFNHRSAFNVIDMNSGWKVDLIVCRDRPFSRTEFNRRMSTTIEGIDVWVASPEDVVLSKLEWARRGESERQLRDVHAVVRASGGALDRPYLERWASQLDVSGELRAILESELGTG